MPVLDSDGFARAVKDFCALLDQKSICFNIRLVYDKELGRFKPDADSEKRLKELRDMKPLTDLL